MFSLRKGETLTSVTESSRKQISKTVALFGEVLADIFPDQNVLGGAPFNVARHLQAFGLHPCMISRAGNDALRDDLLREMDRLGMDKTGIQCDPTYPTGQVRVHMKDGGHSFEILPDQAYDHIHAGVTHMMTMSLKPELAYFGTLAQRGMESRLALDKFLADSKCPRFLDINLRSPWYNKHTVRRSLLRSDIVKMNEDELEIVSDYFKISDKTPLLKAEALVEQFELSCLLITCGENGAWLINRQHEVFSTTPAENTQTIIDTVGAGDAFAAVFIIGLLNQWEMPVAMQRADQFAAALCGIRGGAPQNQDFYLPFKQAWQL
ncbi:PfkB domain protein [Nitrosomonas mobilis]|uniref:PfkB domain protein n=1 Tax=Nitrosomonas mobilis TaxID=51642 RepID=A0A1G5SIR0_9PROT|nr:PfkB domain protein [Nitrosomonas mobilis]